MKRHKWGEPNRDVHLTVRICRVCGLAKITHHEGDRFPWVTYRFDGDTADVSPMPQCDAA